MFKAVFDLGLTTHAQAIEYAENVMKATLPDDSYQNEWMYFLLGDPAMKIRRTSPWPFELATPESLPAGVGGPASFTAQVLDPATGGPVAGVLVSAYKPGLDGGDEVLANAYSDANGLVILPSPKSLGDVVFSIRDLAGNVTLKSVPAQTGAFVDLGDALAGASGEPRLASDATLLPGSSCVIDVENGLPFGFGALAVGGNDNPLPLLGGIVHPFPSAALVPVVLDAQGAWSLKVDPWPAQASGKQLVMQAAILDAGAPQGVALTNALRTATP